MKINRARNVVWGKLVVMVEERVEAMEVDVGYIYYELVAMEDEAVAQIDEGGATTSAPQPCHHHSSSAATTTTASSLHAVTTCRRARRQSQ